MTEPLDELRDAIRDAAEAYVRTIAAGDLRSPRARRRLARAVAGFRAIETAFGTESDDAAGDEENLADGLEDSVGPRIPGFVGGGLMRDNDARHQIVPLVQSALAMITQQNAINRARAVAALVAEARLGELASDTVSVAVIRQELAAIRGEPDALVHPVMERRLPDRNGPEPSDDAHDPPNDEADAG